MNTQQIIFLALTFACKRFMAGLIKEHKAYQFYNGITIKFFLADWQVSRIDNLHEYTTQQPLMFNDTLIGEWTVCPPNGKWNHSVVVHLDDNFHNNAYLIYQLSRMSKSTVVRGAFKACLDCGLHNSTSEDRCLRCEHLAFKNSPEYASLIF